MSKLAIVLCTVFFASVANAFIWTSTLQAAQQSVQDFVEKTITNLQQDVIATQEKGRESAVQLTEQTVKASDDVWDELSSAMQNINDDIIELTNKAENVDIEGCLKMSNSLGASSVAIFSSSNECMNNNLKQGYGYIETVDKVANEMLFELSEIKEKVEHCGDQIYGVITTITAKVCAKQGAASAAWVSIRGRPKLAVLTYRLDSFMANLPLRLAECSGKDEIARFHRESSAIVSRTKTCIQQKIDNARTTTSTTTTISSSSSSSPTSTTITPTEIDQSSKKEAIASPTTPKTVENSEENAATESSTDSTIKK